MHQTNLTAVMESK